MVPEAVMAMQACARIGAIHSIVFGGFSSASLKDRIEGAGAKLLITADGGHRGGNIVDKSEEHTSELQSLMRISYAVFCLKKKKKQHIDTSLTTIIKDLDVRRPSNNNITT